jgi:NAD+-dependent secondary alcohol dehydrogenase Adh1
MPLSLKQPIAVMSASEVPQRFATGASLRREVRSWRSRSADHDRRPRCSPSCPVIGYGGELRVPAIDVISAEIGFVGNLVGTYNELVELMTLARQGTVTLHTRAYPLDAINDAMDDLDHGRLHGRGILVP